MTIGARYKGRLTVAVAFPPSSAAAWMERLETATEARYPFLDLVVCTDLDALRLASPDILICHEAEFVAAYLRGLPEGLKWVHFMSAGVDRALAAIGKRHVRFKVTNVRGIHAEAMREYVLAVYLSFTKRLQHWVMAKQERSWCPEALEMVAGKQALIVGAGAIGTAVAGGCRAFGMNVVGVSTSGFDRPEFDRMSTLSDLLTELRQADLVVLSLPLTPLTIRVFGADAFKSCRRTSFFVNLGRGALVDEGSLAEALHTGRLAGAAVDAFSEEPLPPTSPLWDTPNLLITPHVSGRFRTGWARGVGIFLENLQRHLDGAELIAEVDVNRGY